MMNKPFLLKPAFKDYLWGGSRLNDDFGKNIDSDPLAETWECSTHPAGLSTVDVGEFKGMFLSDVLKLHPEYLGTHTLQTTGGKAELPILIKLIDAKENLSVQVHPDDDYALQHENSLGKTEMWYVLAAKKGAKLVYGFNRNMDKDKVKEAVRSGSIEKYLNYVPVNANDLFYIEAGIVHAIGAGTIVAEIQENSDVTYRIYDYKRIDKNGRERELHLDKALEIVDLCSLASPKQPMRVLKYKKGCASELLSRCKYFQVERLLLNTEVYKELTDFKTNNNSFHVLLCVEGCGVILGDEFVLNFFKGDCVFVPANSDKLKLHGMAQLLDISS